MSKGLKVTKLNRIGPYIKLQTKLGFTSEKKRTKGQIAARWIALVLIFAIFLFVSYFIFKALKNQTEAIQPRQYCILLFTLDELFLFIYCIIAQIKQMFNPTNINILLTFPLSNTQRYIGELIAILIKAAIYNFAIFFPIVIIYGAAMGLFNVIFFFCSMFAVIFTVLMPFGLSILFAIPIIYLTKLLRDKEVVKFILFVVFFIAIIVVYCILLDFLAEAFYQTQHFTEVLKSIDTFLKAMDRWYNPAFYSSVIALNWKVGYAFMIHVAAAIVFAGLGVLGSYPIFKSLTLTSNAENFNVSKATKFDNRNVYTSTFIKDFKQIFRTPAYAYFFLGVAVCMPILTYLSTDLIRTFGEARVGAETFFGLCLLSMLVILSLIGSYSANTLSREQSQFYLTKIAPVSPRKLLLVKGAVTFTVGCGGLLLCTAVLAGVGTHKFSATSMAVLTPTNILVIFGTGLLFLIGICFNGLNLNLGRPAINLSGEPNESNIGIQLAIGIIVALAISLLSTVSSAISGKQTALLYVVVLCLALFYALVNFVVYMLTANRRFQRIEVK